ncbi:hypothetical protein DL766_002234 [Monosporascus sp. MC13-8B]|uniref:Uncharacterized protein n=1 Tax=Monosporascus cannonballus TaxID=155416 RepID=A0ABY0HKH8_9PEZI|nr:hypothetical protein DL763_004142 [Monosporascus cannonballus]RYO94611.1 hypothetical protein DL762_000503 [Monosporascus cannonballus]RYP35964.1 hypothetical protein DL766_002234 [Monosporascus sp. MC13-8B]
MTASSSRFIKSAAPGVRPRHLPVPGPQNRTDPDHHHGGANGTRPDAVEVVGFIGHETIGLESKTAAPAATEGVAIEVPHNCTGPHCTSPSHYHGGNGTRLSCTDPNHHIDANGMANCPSCRLSGLGLAAALPAAVAVVLLV